jgi:hypothetical protein
MGHGYNKLVFNPCTMQSVFLYNLYDYIYKVFGGITEYLKL